jgi:hypothetical protein
VIAFGLKGRTCYVVFRDPKPRTEPEGTSLKTGPGVQSSKVRTTDFTWADANSLEDSDWDLVIMDWRVVSPLDAGKEPTLFASMNPGSPEKSVKCDIIKGELSFSLDVAKEKLTAGFHRHVDIAAKKSGEKMRQVKLGTDHNNLTKEFNVFQRSLDREKNKDAANKLRLQLEERNSSLKNVEQEQAKIKKRLDLYQQYQNLNQGYLYVGIGLRLSNGKVIEIARLGPRWK